MATKKVTQKQKRAATKAGTPSKRELLSRIAEVRRDIEDLHKYETGQAAFYRHLQRRNPGAQPDRMLEASLMRALAYGEALASFRNAGLPSLPA